MKKMLVLATVLGCLCFAMDVDAAKEKNPAMLPIEDVAGLPRVLLLGDSISIGYTLATRAALKDEANVHRAPENCGPTTRGLANIDRWLGDGKWDVIHFNWGLHDLKYMDESGKLVAPEKGKPQVPVEDYKKNLEELVLRLKETGAALIWCSTTPAPEGSSGRIGSDVAKYNAAALSVVEKHKVRVHDLYQWVKTQNIPHVKPDNVHFSEAGSGRLSESVAKAIREELREREAGGK